VEQWGYENSRGQIFSVEKETTIIKREHDFLYIIEQNQQLRE